jgi:hypothetical protein
MTDMFASESSVPSGGPANADPQAGDVTGALTELERKLRELQQELSSIGRRHETGEATVPPPALASGRIVDEAVEATPPPTAVPPAPAAPSAPATTTSAPTDSAIHPEAPAATPGDARLESLAELRRFRDRLERFGRELAAEYDALLGRVMAGLAGTPTAAAQSSQPAAPAPPVVSEEDARENALFEGRVELGVGPFYDIGALGAFEQRLTGLPGVSEASVRRFEASHAVVDIRLAAPVALVKELRRALNTDFSIREVAGGRILLTFDDA